MTPAPKGYGRGGEEFSRVVNFSDAVFHTSLALTSWLLTYPLEFLLSRRRPPGVDEYLLD